MSEHETETPSHRAEQGKPESDTDVTADQSELSLGAMARGTVGTEGARNDTAERAPASGSPGADTDRREAGA
jgi:hypothetical protein